MAIGRNFVGFDLGCGAGVTDRARGGRAALVAGGSRRACYEVIVVDPLEPHLLALEPLVTTVRVRPIERELFGFAPRRAGRGGTPRRSRTRAGTGAVRRPSPLPARPTGRGIFGRRGVAARRGTPA